ncbi:MAG: NAD(P)/FAD-dependent oxidoreductase [Chloroflexi bacterium]|nr:MAG: NAD(P)/FAD-dependent oxidoreductase [Chloroflexota bacterium]
MAVADFVAEAFESDPLRALIASRGIQYTAMGPWSAGTTAVLLTDSAGNDGGAPGQTVFAKGGPGAVADALAASLRAFGGQIRTGTEVTAITSVNGRANGVVLAGGEEIGARCVISGLDPKTTLTRLLDPVEVGPTLGWRANNYRSHGSTAKVNLALSALPRFTAAGDEGRQLLRGRIVIATGIDDLERAFDDSKYGRMSAQPYIEANRTGTGRQPCHECRRAVGALPASRLRVGRLPRHPRRPRRPQARGVRAGHRRPRGGAAGPHAARPRARVRAGGRSPTPWRAVPRPVLPVAATPRTRALPNAARAVVPVRIRRAPGWWGHRPARPERGPRDPVGLEEASPIAADGPRRHPRSASASRGEAWTDTLSGNDPRACPRRLVAPWRAVPGLPA